MGKRIAVLAVVLLLSSASFANEQTQGTNIITGDQVLLQQGTQTADAIQNLAVLTGQQMDGAVQSLLANIGGVSNASSEGAEVGVIRSLEVTGWQGQILGGPVGPKREDQTSGLSGLLSIGLNPGPGAADALQQIVLAGDQNVTDLAGASTATTSTLALQRAQMSGFPAALSGVETSMFTNTVQSQINL